MDKTPGRYCTVLIYLLLCVATLISYEPVRHNDFVRYDDDIYVTENPMVMMGLTRQSVIWAFKESYASNWHPLTWLSHMFDCQLFGLNPLAHHLTSLLLHIANTLLLFWIFKRMTARIWPSAFIAAAFALHPLHIESVAWVAERKDVLSGFFWMLTIVAYIRYTERPCIGRYILIFLAFALGLMAKPMLVTLPFVLLLLDYWPLKRLNFPHSLKDEKLPTPISDDESSSKSALRPLIIEKLPLFVLALISSIITFLVQQKGGAMGPGSNLALNVRMSNALASYVGYIVKILYPRYLTALYPHPGGTQPLWKMMLIILILTLISAAAIYKTQNRRYLLVGWLWYLGTLVPVIGLVQVGVQAMADRYTYLPSIGIFIMLTWGFYELLPERPYRKITLSVLTTAAVIAMMICTRTQVKYWKNSFTLFERALNVTRNNYTMYYNYGNLLSFEEQFSKAVEYYNTALSFDPQYYNAHNNKGLALLELDRVDEAADCFNKALEIKPGYNKAHYNMGLAMTRLDKLDQAVINFKKALEDTPHWPEAHYKLAVIYHRMGKLNLAVEHCAKAVELKPDYLEANTSMAHALFEMGQIQSAIEYFYKILRLAPDSGPVLNDLAWILATMEDKKFRNPSVAVIFAQEACQTTQYRQPDMLDTLAVAYAADGNFTEAIKTAQKALELAQEDANDELVQKIRRRIELYNAGRPYLEPPQSKNDSEQK